MIYHNIFEETGAEKMWLSGITLCAGMAADYAERKLKMKPAHRAFPVFYLKIKIGAL